MSIPITLETDKGPLKWFNGFKSINVVFTLLITRFRTAVMSVHITQETLKN